MGKKKIKMTNFGPEGHARSMKKGQKVKNLK